MTEHNVAMPGTGRGGFSAPARTVEHAVDVVIVGSSSSFALTSRTWQVLKWAVSFPTMLGAFLVGAAFYAGRLFTVDPDLWWHIKDGQAILATHSWPTVDPYSFTVAGQPWMTFEWLGDVVIAWANRVGGVVGLDGLLIILGGAIMLALYLFATIRSGNSKAGFLAAAILFPLANPSFSMRPQMIGYLFLILTLAALELFRQGKQWPLYFLPLLFLLWVNAHGSFIVGIGVIFMYLVCGLKEFRLGGIEGRKWTPKERLRLEFIFLLCLAALPSTPYGTRLAVFPLQVASSLPISVASILEWLPMPLSLLGGKIFLALVLGFFVVQMVSGFQWRLEEIALFLGGVTLACIHVRFLMLFVPFFAPLLAVILARWLPRYDKEKDKHVLNAILIAGIIAAMVYYFPSRASLEKKVASQFPVQAVEYLRQHPVPGPMFDSYDFGGYLVLSGYKVFIDGRSEVYERGGVLSDYLHITMLQPGAIEVLRSYGIQSCLLARDAPLATVLTALPDWHKVYSDDTSALFVRRKVLPASGAPAAKPAVRGE